MLWNASEEYGNVSECEEDGSTDGEDEDSSTEW